jgi:hypothetical protein
MGATPVAFKLGCLIPRLVLRSVSDGSSPKAIR